MFVPLADRLLGKRRKRSWRLQLVHCTVPQVVHTCSENTEEGRGAHFACVQTQEHELYIFQIAPLNFKDDAF